jgi:hypothetical protein
MQFVILNAMYLKILAHPVFVNLNFHMPMIVDLSHPLIMLQGENGSGKSTLLHSIYYALRGEKPEGYVYRLEPGKVSVKKVFLFDAEAHNPRTQLDLFQDQPQMQEFLQMASHAADAGVSADGEPRPGDAFHVSRKFPQPARGHYPASGRAGNGAFAAQSAPHSEDAQGTGRPEEVSHRLRHPFPNSDRRLRDVRH